MNKNSRLKTVTVLYKDSKSLDLSLTFFFLLLLLVVLLWSEWGQGCELVLLLLTFSRKDISTQEWGQSEKNNLIHLFYCDNI